MKKKHFAGWFDRLSVGKRAGFGGSQPSQLLDMLGCCLGCYWMATCWLATWLGADLLPVVATNHILLVSGSILLGRERGRVRPHFLCGTGGSNALDFFDQCQSSARPDVFFFLPSSSECLFSSHFSSLFESEWGENLGTQTSRWPVQKSTVQGGGGFIWEKNTACWHF